MSHPEAVTEREAGVVAEVLSAAGRKGLLKTPSMRFPSVMARAAVVPRVDCSGADANSNLCEKPAVSSDKTGIIIGSLAGAIFLALVVVLAYLHVRRQKRDKQEWTRDPQELEDYGLDAPAKAARKTQAQQRRDPTQHGGVGNGQSRGSMRSLTRSSPDNPFGSSAEIIHDDHRSAQGPGRY